MRFNTVMTVLLAAALCGVASSQSRPRPTSATGSVTVQATGPDSIASAISEAFASGGKTAVADAIAEAAQTGEATAVAEAILEASDTSNTEALAEAVARVTGETVGKIKGELDGGDVKGLAEAIAKSRGGRTRAVAESVATAISETQDAIVTAVTTSVSAVKNGKQASAQARIAAEAIGEAVALAYAKAEVLLEVEGAGEAFGGAQADVTAVAEASAKVIAQAYAEATDGVGVAKANIIGEAVTEVIAKAAANAFVKADITGPGKVEAIQETLADSISIPIATVIGEALAVTFKGSSEASTFVESETTVEDSAAVDSKGASITKGTSSSGTATGSGGADTEQTVDEASGEGTSSVGTKEDEPVKSLPRCRSKARTCCGGRVAQRTWCGCSRGGRSAGNCTLQRQASKNGRTTVWKTIKDGSLCGCF